MIVYCYSKILPVDWTQIQNRTTLISWKICRNNAGILGVTASIRLGLIEFSEIVLKEEVFPLFSAVLHIHKISIFFFLKAKSSQLDLLHELCLGGSLWNHQRRATSLELNNWFSCRRALFRRRQNNTKNNQQQKNKPSLPVPHSPCKETSSQKTTGSSSQK